MNPIFQDVLPFPADRALRAQALKAALKERILVLDGAMGTAIQDLGLGPEDFGGEDLEGCNEHLILTRPELIQSIHEKYLRAGCDIVETNTFGATPMVLEEYGLGARAHEINRKAAQIALAAATKFSTPERLRFVAGSIGPTTKALSVTGGVTFEGLVDQFFVQAEGLWDGGVDYFLIETCQDTRNIKAALVALDRLFAKHGACLPIAVSGTIEASGTMLAGQTAESLAISLDHRELLYIGLNCATGPEFMTDHLRSLAEVARVPVFCVPNAGLPDEHGCYLESPSMVSQVLERFIERGWINGVGGCCGTHAGHIESLCKLVEGKKPRQWSRVVTRSLLSGIDAFEVTDEMRPIVVGERTNVIGSAKFKRLISAGQFEEATEVARAQIKNGAQIIDLCLANPDRNELEDSKQFLEKVINKVRVPLMIDSTDAKVIAMALTYSQGKAIINSINLEDGEERFDEVLPLARQFGAALVVGTIDDDPEQGMGISRERKLAIAEREYVLLTEKWGIPPQDIYWDPLVFPCGTGDAQYVGSALETIEGIRLIKARFPGTRTVLGISNVSFGLPPTGREVLNSVFLYHCVQAGLDLAIVNSEKLERFSSIPAEEIRLSEDLLFNRGEDPLAAFAAYFREKQGEKKENASDKRKLLPVGERLASLVVEGSKEGLHDDLDEMLKTLSPLEVVNGPLMKGMDEVGRLFNANQLIVAEVLQSAEVMKAAVSFLEPKMEKTETSLRGTVLLATVKGDVHDIGKNLVDIILSNNGFRVINLGIKIPPEKLIEAAREHRPDIIGLSGLLVKSAQMMVLTAEDLKQAGVHAPILVGGAALSRAFTDRHIAPAYGASQLVAYAKDAMEGLDLAKKIVDPQLQAELRADIDKARVAFFAAAEAKKQAQEAFVAPVFDEAANRRSANVSVIEQAQIPQPPDFERHILRTTPIEQIWQWINPLMLYGRHLGLKGGMVRKLEGLRENPGLRHEIAQEDARALQIWDQVESFKKQYRTTDLFAPRAVFQFFRARSKDNSISVEKPGKTGAVWSTEFPRQKRPDGLCLADYLREDRDVLALFVVSVGSGVRERANELKESGQFLESHVLQALALESAEAYAELLHSQIRRAWGFADAPEMTLMQKFQAKYHGKRYSFGYPACPRLEDQSWLFEALNPSEIGVELTEGYMMDPEASVSAIVFHHPEASYFSVGEVGDGLPENRLG